MLPLSAAALAVIAPLISQLSIVRAIESLQRICWPGVFVNLHGLCVGLTDVFPVATDIIYVSGISDFVSLVKASSTSQHALEAAAPLGKHLLAE